MLTGKRLDDLMRQLWGKGARRGLLLRLSPGLRTMGLPSLITLSLFLLLMAQTEVFKRWPY